VQRGLDKEEILMVEPQEFMGVLTPRHVLRETLRGRAPSLLVSVAGALLMYSLIYSLLRPHFPPTGVQVAQRYLESARDEPRDRSWRR
jgi:hypothetical protein